MIGWVSQRRARKPCLGEESDSLGRGPLVDDIAGLEQDEVVEEGEELGLGLVDRADDRRASRRRQGLELGAERQGRDGIEACGLVGVEGGWMGKG